jgi:site-specific DNA recombinase
MTRAKNAFGYVRLSKWDKDSTSPLRQRQAIQRLCRERGWKLLEVFEDIDISAWNGKHRPGFEAMMARLADTDALVFWQTSRLARSLQHLLKIVQECEAANVELVSTDGRVDTTTAMGKAFVQIRGVFDELESSTISERSRSMVATKHERGEPLGRPPFGWKREGKKFVIDTEQQATLRQAAERYVSGESFNGIAKSLGFHVGPLSKMLHSQRVQEALPPDLAGELAQALLARKRERVPTSRQSLLGGIARCGRCGAGLNRTSTRPNWFSYGCGKCHGVAISGAFLEEFITAQVLEAVDSGRLLEAVKRRKATGRTRKASELEARLELLETAHFVDGTITKARYDKLHAALIEALAKAQEVERHDGIDLPEELARDLTAAWPRLTVQERRRIIQAVLSEVVVAKATGKGPVDPARVTLVWRE